MAIYRLSLETASFSSILERNGPGRGRVPRRAHVDAGRAVPRRAHVDAGRAVPLGCDVSTHVGGMRYGWRLVDDKCFRYLHEHFSAGDVLDDSLLRSFVLTMSWPLA